MLIDDNKLRELLGKRKKDIERPKYNGLSEIITGISFFLTLIVSDFHSFNLFDYHILVFALFIFALFISFYGIVMFIQSLFKRYTIGQLYSEIENLDSSKIHKFDIIIFEHIHRKGEFLVVKNRRWKSWLFLNYNSSNSRKDYFDEDDEIEHLIRKLHWDFGEDKNFSLVYVDSLKIEKYSYGDKINKKYLFNFFLMDKTSYTTDNRKFFVSGKNCKWMTLDEMYANVNFYTKNKELLDFIRTKL